MSTELPVIDRRASVDCARFHLSLNVDDLKRSIEFFSVLFDAPPAKNLDDYAKFEVAEPPLVLSLAPHRVPRGGKLNHLGFRLLDVDHTTWQRLQASPLKEHFALAPGSP
jgi:Glyoxalase/Bleomycin resistance protein/Dioxygenase superfamily